MKNTLKIIGLVFISLFALNTQAQFTASPAYETVSSGPNALEYKSVGAISNGRNIAISRQYLSLGTTNKGRRDLRYFDFSGNLLAQSDNYSHDNHFFTKILFDPNNENVVYALYTQRKSHAYLPEPDVNAPEYTYLRRFVRNGSLVTMSSEYAVFHNGNPSNFVIAPNGDLLVANSKDNGQVNIRPVRWTGTWTSAPEFMVSYPNTARRSATPAPGATHLWPLSMDMKDNVFIIGHNRGYYYNSNHYIQIKKGLYNPASQTASSIYVYYIQEKSLAGSGSATGTQAGGPIFNQNIALRPDGGIMFISRLPSAPANSPVRQLNNMAASGSNTVLEVTNGYHTNVVVTEDNKTFFATSNTAGAFHINLYNSVGDLEHTYTPAPEIVNNLNNLAVKDCKLLATTTQYPNYGTSQHHQFFSCSDCNGEVTAAGEFTGQFIDREVRSHYGPMPVSVFCSPEDIIFNGLPSTCENRVEISVAPIDLNTWTTGPELFTGDICNNCSASSNIPISNYVDPLIYGQYYHFTFRVYDTAGNASEIFFIFMIEHCGKQGDPDSENLNAKIYPNPTRGEFKVSVTNNENKGTLEVLDLYGNVVFQGIFSGEESTPINISNERPGVYFIKFYLKGETFTKKIIKK